MAAKYSPKPPAPIPFTKGAYKKMHQDQKRLQQERGEILVRLQTAREMGDLSENGAYHAAKFELRTTDRELRRLAYLIKYGVVTKPKHSGIVDFGSQVTLETGGQQLEFTMVGKHESDPQRHKLSVQSPIGQAIMGKSAGDQVTVSAPAGETSYKITKIS